MTLSIELPKDLEKELSAEADQLGLPLPEYALRLLAVARRPDAHPADGAGLISYWRKESLIGSRPDIADSQEHARELRARASQEKPS